MLVQGCLVLSRTSFTITRLKLKAKPSLLTILMNQNRMQNFNGVHNAFGNVPFCRYSIDRSSDPGRFFYVDVTTGALMTARPLDREDVAWHNITVLAVEMSKAY